MNENDNIFEIIDYICGKINERDDLAASEKENICMIVRNLVNIDFLTMVKDKSRVDLNALYTLELTYKQLYATYKAWKPSDLQCALQLLNQQYERETFKTNSITITFN